MDGSMEGDTMKTFFEVAFEVLGCAVLVIGMITIFVGAVLQESYRHLIDKEKENDIRRTVKNA